MYGEDCLDLFQNCSCALDAIFILNFPGNTDSFHYRIQAYAGKTPGRIEKSEHAHLQTLQNRLSAQQRDLLLN